MMQANNARSRGGDSISIREAYQGLANAIVIRAASDYEIDLVVAKRNGVKPGVMLHTSAEKFLQSEWFQALTNVDGDYIMRGLQRKVYGK